MKVKVSEATKLQLNWMVAKALGLYILLHGNEVFVNGDLHEDSYDPAGNWAQGGPIIEREKLTLSDCGGGWAAGLCGTLNSFGPTALVAVCRCFIVSRLGGEVEVPEELCTPST